MASNTNNNDNNNNAQDGNTGFGEQVPGFGEQAPGFGRQNQQGHQGPGFGPQTPGFGQSTPSFGYQAYGFGQQGPGFGQPAPGFGQQNQQGHQGPGFGPQTPGFGQSTPGFGQLTPGFGQFAPGFGQFAPGFGQQPYHSVPGFAQQATGFAPGFPPAFGHPGNPAPPPQASLLIAMPGEGQGGQSLVQLNELGPTRRILTDRDAGLYISTSGTAGQAHRTVDAAAKDHPSQLLSVAVKVERGYSSTRNHKFVPLTAQAPGAGRTAPKQDKPSGGPQKQDKNRSGHGGMPRREKDAGTAAKAPGGIQKSQKPTSQKDTLPAKLGRYAAHLSLPKPTSPSSPVCGNCKEPGHVLAICAHPSEDGFVHGCPFCNDSGHELLEDCPRQQPVNPWKVFQWAITKRANRPPLALYKDWMHFLQLEMLKGDPPRGTAVPKQFPWTPEYCDKLLKQGTEPWLTFDYKKNNPMDLPYDPLTRNMKAVKQNYAVIYNSRFPVPDSPLMPRHVFPCLDMKGSGSKNKIDPLKEDRADGRNVHWQRLTSNPALSVGSNQ